MNVTLGSGKAVHASVEIEGYLPWPQCGGNKSGERYSTTKHEVTCKKCLKKMAARAEAAERTAYYAGLAEAQDDVMSQAEAAVEAAETEAWIDKVLALIEEVDAEKAAEAAVEAAAEPVAETVIELDMVEPTKGFVAISGHGVVGTVLHTELRGGARGDGWSAEDEDGIEVVSRSWDKAKAAVQLACHLGFQGPLRVRVNREYSNA